MVHPGLYDRYWPTPGPAANGAAVASTGAVGLTAALLLTAGRPGLGWLLVGLAVAGGTTFVLRSHGTRLPRIRLIWAGLAIALLTVPVVRAAEWLFLLCVPAAVACGGLALAGGRTTTGLLVGATAGPQAAVRSTGWIIRGVRALRRGEGNQWLRLVLATGIGLALLLVFGLLFVSADPAFARLVNVLWPDVGDGGTFAAICRFLIFGWGAAGAAYLASRPPAIDRMAAGARRPVRRLEWLVPIVALDLLFATFVAVQIRTWFGGDEVVLNTAHLTYAEYARGGFWQLTIVTVLTLAVIAVAARKAPRGLDADRIALRAALGGLTVLALVVVVSALARMGAYEAAYGLTRLRLLVAVCEVWFGAVLVMVLIAGVRLRPFGRQKGNWLPPTAFGLGVGLLLGLAALNPDGFIAERNIDRFQRTGRLDRTYLAELSDDALPAIAKLPEPDRACVLELMGAYRPTLHVSDAWYEYNWGRAHAEPLPADEIWSRCRP